MIVSVIPYSEDDYLPWRAACKQAEQFLVTLTDEDRDILTGLLEDCNIIVYDWLSDHGCSPALRRFIYLKSGE